MLDDKSLEELQNLLTENFSEIDKVLKALGTSQRQKLLINLLEGPKTFQELKESVLIERTALSNHLLILKEAMLVDKIHHGFYRLTQTGKVFLQAIYSAYELSLTENIKHKEAEQKKFLMDSFLKRKNK